MKNRRVFVFAGAFIVAISTALLVKVFVMPLVVHTPLTLVAVGLEGKQWTEADYLMAAKIELKRQEILYPKIETMAARQDYSGLTELAVATGSHLRDWNDQPEGPLKNKFRPCLLSQAKLLGMVLDGNISNKAVYRANRDACDALIGWW